MTEMDHHKICRVVEKIMIDFSDQIDSMGLMKSLIDAIFKKHSKKPFKIQLFIYSVFILSTAFSIGLWHN